MRRGVPPVGSRSRAGSFDGDNRTWIGRLMKLESALAMEERERERDALVWQARAQTDLAVLIERYLMEHPPPSAATDPDLYRGWAADLRAAGQADLEALAARRLRVA